MDSPKKILRLLTAMGYTVRDEFNEIKDIEPSEDDKKEAERLSVILASVAVAAGCPIPTALTPIIERLLAKVIRDAKDGVRTPDKLIYRRLINYLK